MLKNRKKTKILGLTGGIATGKSTASAFFQRQGVPVICADGIAHQVTQKGQPAFKKVVAAFSRGVVLSNGKLDRQALGDLVFQKPKLKKTLEGIIHPYVRREIKKQLAQFKKRGCPLVVLDIPLLFEGGLQSWCDVTLCLYATQTTQIARLKTRGMSRKHALARIKAQMPLHQKCQLADFVVKNESTKRCLYQALKRVLGEV